MFDHIGITVSDLARSERFYDAVLTPLGAIPMPSPEPDLRWWRKSGPSFSISTRGPAEAEVVHFAFAAATHREVEQFYQAGLAAGGRDNGPPGIRPHYGPHYYAAFLLDPDGYNVEAVCQYASA